MSVLQGVVPAVVTPFDDNGQLDERSLQTQITHEIDAGAAGLLVCGLAGEGTLLSFDERRRVAEIAVDVAGPVPLLVGCSADTTADAVRLVRSAVACGASGVMVAPPRRPDLTPNAAREHYRAVSAAAGACEVMIQDAPFALGVELGVELVLDLARELPNASAYKIEALPYWDNALRARDVAGGELRVFGGHGGLYLLDVLDSGATGLIPGADLTAPLVRAWRAYAAGDRAAAVAEHARILPLLVFQAQSLALLVGGAKAILVERGVIATPRSRLPGADLSSVTRDRMLGLAREAGVR
jgi:4-hydroxy-tetrahydrodipicolinate synthase